MALAETRPPAVIVGTPKRRPGCDTALAEINAVASLSAAFPFQGLASAASLNRLSWFAATMALRTAGQGYAMPSRASARFAMRAVTFDRLPTRPEVALRSVIAGRAVPAEQTGFLRISSTAKKASAEASAVLCDQDRLGQSATRRRTSSAMRGRLRPQCCRISSGRS